MKDGREVAGESAMSLTYPCHPTRKFLSWKPHAQSTQSECSSRVECDADAFLISVTVHDAVQAPRIREIRAVS